MAEYRFLTTWCVDAPLADVWEAIHASEQWPAWWKGVERATRVERGDANDIGALWRYRWRSALPYSLEFETRTTKVEKPYLIEADAVGELRGTGRWRFFEGRGVAVIYEWNVETTAAWMNALAPVLRPAFRWNHHLVMRQGGIGLARLLGAPLLASS